MGEALDRLSMALASKASRRSTLIGVLAGAAIFLPWTANAQEDIAPIVWDCVTLNGVCIPG
jgi:hypothetical protein